MNDQQDFSVKKIKVEDSKSKKSKPEFRIKKKHLKVGLGIVIFLLILIAGIAFLKGWFSFSKTKVELEITGPTEVASGEEVKFDVRYSNDNRVSLKDAKLIIDYPHGAYSLQGEELTQQVFDLETISPKQEGVKQFEIRLTGEKGSIKPLRVRLTYQPENISSEFENTALLKPEIRSVLIGLYLTIPQEAINGEEVSYTIDYLNNTDREFNNLRVELIYPSGFSFQQSQPEPAKENNIWEIENLGPEQRGTIKVSGTLEGLEGEKKILKTFISKVENDKSLQYSQADSITTISSSPLLLSLSLNNQEEVNSVDPGEKLNYKIEFKNNTDIALSQLILKINLKGGGFDFQNLNLQQKGFFDSLNNIITWSAADVSSLALLPPNQSGEVKFSVSIAENLTINSSKDKNFEAIAEVELETVNVPPQFNLDKLKVRKTFISKINSNVTLGTKAYHNESSADITNFGPIPPQVNKTTTYTIHWQITNSSNDLKNVRVSAVLPQGTVWRDVHSSLSKNSHLEYNQRTNRVTWTIDSVPAGTGFLIPAHELVFQIALRPSITQIGTTPVLIDESSLEAEDSFTGETLEAFSHAIATDLPDDSLIGIGDGEVVE